LGLISSLQLFENKDSIVLFTESNCQSRANEAVAARVEFISDAFDGVQGQKNDVIW
jgi:hypothetical protein